jgi:hypothetical protein
MFIMDLFLFVLGDGERGGGGVIKWHQVIRK